MPRESGIVRSGVVFRRPGMARLIGASPGAAGTAPGAARPGSGGTWVHNPNMKASAMDPNPGPVLRRRQAGIRLRQLREAAGKSLGDVAAYLDCSAAKISRIETGRLRARIPDVRN